MPTIQELETLVTKLEADNKDILRKLKETEDAFKKLESSFDNMTKKSKSSFDSLTNSSQGLTTSILATTTALVGLEGGLLGVSQRAVKLAADAEGLRIAFKVMTGSVQEADRTIKELYDFTAKTPFQVGEVVDASRKMLAAGIDSRELVKIMKQLGDVASGVDKPLNEIVYTFTSIKSQGTAMTTDLREFNNRGIPIWTALAKVMGMIPKAQKDVSESQMVKLRQMTEQGRITFQLVERAFKELSGPGGTFENMTEEQSKTLKGLFSNLTDTIDNALRDVGKDIVSELKLKELVDFATRLTQQFKDLDPEVKRVILTTMGLTAATAGLITGIIAAKVAYAGLTTVLGAYITRATLATSITLGLRAASFGLGAYLATQFMEAYGGAKEFREEVERSNKILDQRGTLIDKGFAKQIEESKWILNVDERRKFLADKVTEAKAQEKEASEQLAKAETQMNRLLKDRALTFESFDKDRPWRLAHPKDAAEINESIERTNHYAVVLTRTQKGLDALREAQKFADKEVGGAIGNIKAFTEQVEKLRKETEELGKTEEQRILIAGKRAGMNKQQLDNLGVQLSLLKARKAEVAALEQEKKATDEVVNSVNNLNEAILSEMSITKELTFVQRVRQQQAAVEEEINRLRASRLFKQMNPDYQVKLVRDLVKARDLINSMEWKAELVDRSKEHNKLLESQKEILESIKTPTQKWQEEQQKLNKLFEKGYLSWDQYKTAMNKAEDVFKDATGAANSLRDALIGIDAVLSGGAEARARVSTYREMLSSLSGGYSWRAPAPMPRLASGQSPIDESAPEWLKGLQRSQELQRKGNEERNRNPFPEVTPIGPNSQSNRNTDKIVDLLTKIAMSVAESVQKESVTIEPANIND